MNSINSLFNFLKWYFVKTVVLSILFINFANLYNNIACAQVCYFEVNGFYLGKLRGLLGDGNNEPYDDFRLPNGKVRLYF